VECDDPAGFSLEKQRQAKEQGPPLRLPFRRDAKRSPAEGEALDWTPLATGHRPPPPPAPGLVGVVWAWWRRPRVTGRTGHARRHRPVPLPRPPPTARRTSQPTVSKAWAWILTM